jgi:hypothetical protein
LKRSRSLSASSGHEGSTLIVVLNSLRLAVHESGLTDFLIPGSSSVAVSAVGYRVQIEHLRGFERWKFLRFAKFSGDNAMPRLGGFDAGARFVELPLHLFECVAKLAKLRLHAPSTFQTSLERFSIASVRKPICRLMSVAASVVAR